MGSTKRFLIFFAVAILVFLSPFILLILSVTIFAEEPAIPEKMREILNEELNKQQKKERLNTYIKLLDFLETHKQEIIDSVSRKDTSECLHISFEEYNIPKSSKLPKHLWDACRPLIKSLSTPLTDETQPSLEICDKQFITLASGYTDRVNYLYVSHKFYLKDIRKNRDTLVYSKIVKEVLIKNKYYLRVKVADAFNAIDPNNFAPN